LPRRFAAEVLEPNITDANRFAEAARKLSCYAIDPSRLMVPSWTQEQYNEFWEKVLAKWVRAVVLSPDWIFSKGCVTECIFAMKSSIQIINSNGVRVSREDLELVLKKALRMRDQLSVEAPFLENLARVLSLTPSDAIR
jgi:hypothetical protein